MLVRFNVKNFLSFSERSNGKSEEFSMIAGRVRGKKQHVQSIGDMKLLKFAAVYGANAAGKSNLVKAISFMRDTVLSGKLPLGSENKFCKADAANSDKASYFEFEIMLDHKYYSYGFEVLLSGRKFFSEWLTELSQDGDKMLFSRDIVAGKFEFCADFSSDLGNRLEIYADDIRGDSSVLLLNVLNWNKSELYRQYPDANIFSDIYRWIEDKLDINYPGMPISNYSYFRKGRNIAEIRETMAKFGMDITGFQMADVPIDSVFAKMPLELRKTALIEIDEHRQRKGSPLGLNLLLRYDRELFVISVSADGSVIAQAMKFSHADSGFMPDIADESDGTIRLFDLFEILFSDETGKTYVIDELDRCLHPLLTRRFIEVFLNAAESRDDIQLIVTTHESRIMNLELLRRDEIWFVDKRRSGETDIYSLEEYNTRFDQRIDRAYLDGRYGGIPFFVSSASVREELIPQVVEA